MGTKLNTVLVDHRTIGAEAIAAVALELVTEKVRELYEKGGENGQPVPLEFDAEGQLKNPVFGLYLLISPPHPHGLQMVWQEALEPALAPRVDAKELARRISQRVGKAFYLTYTSVTEQGTLWCFETGREAAVVTNRQAGQMQELDEILGHHFGLCFQQLDNWFGEWYYVHTFYPQYAPHHRGGILDELMLKQYGKTQTELIADYRAGRPLPEDLNVEMIRHYSERWEAYDRRKYPSRLFELASGDLFRGIEGVVRKTPREVKPEWWFQELEAYEAARRAKLNAYREQKYGPKPEKWAFAPEYRQKPFAERLTLCQERIRLSRNWGYQNWYVREIIESLFAMAEFTPLRVGDHVVVTEAQHGYKPGEYVGRVTALHWHEQDGLPLVVAKVSRKHPTEPPTFSMLLADVRTLRRATAEEMAAYAYRSPTDSELEQLRRY